MSDIDRYKGEIETLCAEWENVRSLLEGGVEQKFNSLEEQVESFESFLDNLDDEFSPEEFLAPLTDSIDSFQETFESLSGEVENILDFPNEFRESVETRLDEVLDLSESLIKDFVGHIEDSFSDLGDLGEEIIDSLKEKLESMTDIVEDIGSNVVEDLLGGMDILHNTSDEFIEKLKDSITEHLKEFIDIGDIIEDAGKQALKSLEDEVENKFEEELKSEIEEVISSVTSRLLTEVTNSVVLTQVQTTITTTLSPFIPALLTARVVAASIKHALEIMRAGF